MIRVYSKLYELMLQEAYSALEERVKEAFYAWYMARDFNEYLIRSEVDEEWEKYRAVLVN